MLKQNPYKKAPAFFPLGRKAGALFLLVLAFAGAAGRFGILQGGDGFKLLAGAEEKGISRRLPLCPLPQKEKDFLRGKEKFCGKILEIFHLGW